MRSKRFIRDREEEDWLPEMAGQHYCLRWNNYQSNMTSVFHHLLRTEAFVDVTLACNEESLKAHKVVLSACSSYFQKLLMENPCKHPTIIMPQDVCFSDLKFIIEFVYRGEIDVSQAELQSLLKTADQLKIKGLCEVPDGEGGGGSGEGGGEGGGRTGDAVCAEVTPLPPDTPHTRRFTARLRSGTRHAAEQHANKRRFDARRQIYRESRHMMSQHHHHNNSHNTNNQLAIRHNENQGEDGQLCITVGTSTDDDKSSQSLVVLDGRSGGGGSSHLQQLHPATGDQHSRIMMTSPAPIMSTHSTTTQVVLDAARSTDVDMPEGPPPAGPTATLVSSIELQTSTPPAEGVQTMRSEDGKEVKVKFETLRAMEQGETLDIDSHMSERGDDEHEHSMHTMMITPELLGLIPPGHSSELDMNGSQSDCGSSVCGKNCGGRGEGGGPGMNKSWSQEDMELALDALRNHNMSLTKASATYGIPSTTLWQRAHRMGIDTPKKDGPAKSWTEDVLNVALEALRNGSISANKASKAYGIPSSTLYKIARREGIRLAAPFNAAPTTWNPEDLDRALEAIRSGTTTVQKAATEYGIPSGTLYGRCKREGIELSRSNPTPWSEDAMNEALESVRIGQMSINQAAIHYNLPYSSLYGRFKRIKYEADHEHTNEVGSTSDVDGGGAHTPHTPMSGGVPTPHSVHSTHSVHSAHSTTSAPPPPPSSVQQQTSVQTSLSNAPPPQQQHPPPPPHPPMPHIQPQIMLLQYQQAPPPPLHMYQPAPS